MTRETRGRYLTEWADLVGGSVPDSVEERDESPGTPWEDADSDRR